MPTAESMLEPMLFEAALSCATSVKNTPNHDVAETCARAALLCVQTIELLRAVRTSGSA
jgi:hypothetical protein